MSRYRSWCAVGVRLIAHRYLSRTLTGKKSQALLGALLYISSTSSCISCPHSCFFKNDPEHGPVPYRCYHRHRRAQVIRAMQGHPQDAPCSPVWRARSRIAEIPGLAPDPRPAATEGFESPGTCFRYTLLRYERHNQCSRKLRAL